VFDTRLDDAEELAGLTVVGFGGKYVDNQEAEIARVARELYVKWEKEGKTAQLVVRAKAGKRTLDVSRLREPIHFTYANWRPTPDGIAEFTKKFGSLSENPYAKTGEEELDISSWVKDQHIFRTWWRFGPGSPLPLSEKERQRREIVRQWREEHGFGTVKGPETLLENVCLEGVTLKLSSEKQGVAIEVVAPDLSTYMTLLLLRENPRMLRVCGNEHAGASYCTPYFVAHRRDQGFCCKECSQAIATRRWWALHGNEWRQNRQRQEKQKKTRKRGKN